MEHRALVEKSTVKEPVLLVIFLQQVSFLQNLLVVMVMVELFLQIMMNGQLYLKAMQFMVNLVMINIITSDSV